MIENYIAKHDLLSTYEVAEYVDDGLSGANTNRPSYQSLINDVRAGKIQCIVVKDLSRIGRDYLDVSELLLRLLPSYNVRFIAINNHYDSENSDISVLELALINLMNQLYLKDLAKKSLSSRISKMKKGEYLSCYPIYGYEKSFEEKNKLIVDKVASEYVKYIFQLAVDGHTTTEIARILNAKQIPTASMYKRQQGIERYRNTKNDDHFWNSNLVVRVLTEERYTGKQISYTMTVKESGSKRMKKLPKEQWIVVDNAHEAIISQGIFTKVQYKLKERTGEPLQRIFYDKIVCPYCNYTMKRQGKRDNPFYQCATYKVTDKFNCKKDKIYELDLAKIVLETLKTMADTVIDKEMLALEILKTKKNEVNTKKTTIAKNEKSIIFFEEKITELYTKYLSNEMVKEDFSEEKERLNSLIQQKKIEIQHCQEYINNLAKEETTATQSLELIYQISRIDTLSRAVIDQFIDKIIVHDLDKIEIVQLDKK